MTIFKKIWPLFLIVACFCAIFLKKEEKKPVRVYVSIVGDLFHAGHVELFKKARELGDYLIVGVVSDEEVRKHKREPLTPLEERLPMIAGCRYVDEVIPNCPYGATDELIETYRIDFVVHGDDPDPMLTSDLYKSAIEKNILRFVSSNKGLSITKLIDRVLERDKRHTTVMRDK